MSAPNVSILDGMIANEQALLQSLETMGSVGEAVLASVDLGPRGEEIMALLREGLSLADILDITPAQRNALLVHGTQLVRAGDLEKARAVLLRLALIEPLDEKPVYVLASTYQLEGRPDIAGKLYIRYLALNATDPEGYMRLGECFLANQERQEAADCFGTARNLALAGHGKANALARAERLIALLAPTQS